MLSFKRLVYLVMIVVALGGMFLAYTVNEARKASVPTGGSPSPSSEREFIETRQLNEGTGFRVLILGDDEDARYKEIYGNVRQFCKDLRLTVTERTGMDLSGADSGSTEPDSADFGNADSDSTDFGSTDSGGMNEWDLLIFCDPAIHRYVDLAKLKSFLAGGGRAIFAAGLADGAEESALWPALGIRKQSGREDFHELAFEEPLLPVQPESAVYDGDSDSALMEISKDASVYIRDAKDKRPLFYTYDYQKGKICLINGTFLADARCLGLLSGAIGALLEDFLYPVLGVKAVFLDNFPLSTPAGDDFCMQTYGYSAEGFIRDVVWPAFQGISLRTDTPYTASIPTAASSESSADSDASSEIADSVLQLGGEVSYAADSLEESRAAFPAATAGNAIEDGNLFAVCSALGAYGMIFHTFDINALIAGEGNTAAWDSGKEQIGIFESELLGRAPWLEGRTLSQLNADIRSYQNLDYRWARNGKQIELDCSDAAKGQAFFYHTDSRIVGSEGLTWQDVGNGYYLLRIQEGHGVITLEEAK